MSEEPIIINFEEAGENGGPVELNSTETKSNQIIIYTIYGRRRYELNLNFEDFEKYQFPRAVLNRAAFTDIIMAKKFDVKFNNKNKVIIINITLFADYYIELILIESKKFIFPMEERIAELEKEVAILRKFKQDNDPQLIHSFDYPQWHGEDEFKRLPHYKYIREGIKISDKILSLGRENPTTPIDRDNYNLELKWQNVELVGYLAGIYTTYHYGIFRLPGGTEYYSITDAQYKTHFEERNNTGSVVKYIPFFKSMTVEDYSKNYTLHHNILIYITLYVQQWILKNYNNFLPNMLKIVVEVNGNKIKTNIMKTSQKIKIERKRIGTEDIIMYKLNFPAEIYCNGVQL